jgi:molybdate transport system substrate-binding protein
MTREREAVRGGGRRLRAVAFALLLLLAGAACSGTGEGAADTGREGRTASANETLLVLAASDLQFALPELTAAYRASTGALVESVLGSSGNLAAQVRHGAPADLFFSADAAFVGRLAEEGRIDPHSPRTYARGRLVLVAAPGVTLPVRLEELGGPGIDVVAIAHPEHAPYGRAAREVLVTAELWGRLQPRLVLAESVAHAYQFVRTGNADVGIVALSLVEGTPDPGVEWYLLDADLHSPLDQVAGIVADSPRAERARGFLRFVTSREGRDILARHGFELPASAGG